jgi:hypothetical protein
MNHCAHLDQDSLKKTNDEIGDCFETALEIDNARLVPLATQNIEHSHNSQTIQHLLG